MPVLIEHDARRAAAITALLPDGAHVVADANQLDEWLVGRPDEYAVLVGSDVPLREAGTIAAGLRRTHPSATVVLIRRDLDAEVYRQVMAAGIPAVVGEGDGATLLTAVQRARETWDAIHGPSPEIGGGGRVLTVFSPKGGVGKTTMAVNLALALAGGRSRVCIVDLDLAFGDVAITLQLIPERTILEAVDGDPNLDFALLQDLLTRHSENLSILAAPTAPDGRDRIPPAMIQRVLATLRRHFDYVVVDTSPGFDEPVLQAFDETDELVLVTTLDVPTIKNTKMALETLDLLDLLKDNRHLVLNRADDEVGLAAHNVESILKLPVAVAIPTDMAVANATNHGRPIVAALPDHRVSKAVRELAARVSGAPLPQEDATPARRGGLFGRSRKKEAAK
ncbi:MAG: AAA family ATPase [Marmoricola sp.]